MIQSKKKKKSDEIDKPRIAAAKSTAKSLIDIESDIRDANFENEKINAEARVKAFNDEQELNIMRRNAGEAALRQSVDNLAYLASQVKEMKGVFKAAAIVETLIDTYTGAQGIFKNIASAPFLGPFALPLAIAGAATATAAGLARVAEISKFALGGDFVTRGPQMIMVGENPGGRERVSVTPLSSQNVNGPSTGNINMGNVYISGSADSATVKALNMSREKQLKNLKQMMMELSYARQMPSMA